MLRYMFYSGAVYLGVVSLLGLAYLRAIYRRIRPMNQSEQEAIARLEAEIGNMSKALESEKASNASLQHDNAALTAEVADLTAKLSAAQNDPSEVVTALNALSDKVDAELAPPAAPAPAPAAPPADPNAPPAA